MGRKIEDFSLTNFELWCYKARDYFDEVEDEVGANKVRDALQMIDIYRNYDAELFFLREEDQ